MTHPVKGIDHCYLLVNDLEKAAQDYKKLGFTLSPRGLHSSHMGTANYTIMLSHDYFELLGVVSETPLSDLQRVKLAKQGEGLHAVVGRIDSAKRAHDALIALGIDVGDVQSFSRPVIMPNGEEDIAAFETVTIDAKHVPNGIFFLCEQKTRHTVWQADLMQHENGAKALGTIYIASKDPHHTAKAYAALFANGSITQDGDGFKLVTGENSAQLFIFPPHELNRIFGHINFDDLPHEAYAGFSVVVNNLGKVKQLLEAQNIAWHETSHQTIYIDPQYANGAILEFVA
ncbi:VOC family protein [Bartonella sp. HY329]|uniref:VOC family protein n=1 Tax=unclassified Bartonella TaxID=2645622 RepID=UPI0021C9FE88|nr:MULTISPECIES: VOC family protein [unclassified Bartonella]UXM94157.1 VOC family protein [Bartonella sp. HY329]UXN08479.1 VOC family protein [Bartonella sp. HY328]